MKRWLLRFEASDFGNTLFDSSQLSAIRGASLTFLYSSSLVERLVRKSGKNAQTIYAGASQGAFVFDSDESGARALKAKVESSLAGHDPETGCHQHMSYVTALVEGDGMNALSKAEAICNIASAQKAHPAWPAFSVAQTKPGERRDARPALAGKHSSAAIEDRISFGRKQRQGFYNRFLGPDSEKIGFGFSDEFEQITENAQEVRIYGTEGEGTPVALPLSLHNKMALFFADGNAFGKHRDVALEKSAGLSELTSFSNELVNLQKRLLKAIIDWLGSHHEPGQENAWFGVNPLDGHTRARFETLMWGGDEMLFVMPSWLALEFSTLFFKTVAEWKIGGNPLTYGAGLVICDRKTPISHAKTVAEGLSSLAKSVGRGAGPFGSNTLQLEIFEGLSLPADITSFRDKLYFHGRPAEGAELSQRMEETNLQLTINGEDISRLVCCVEALKRKLPRSQVYKLLDIASTKGVAHIRSATSEIEVGGDRVLREEFKLLKDTFMTYLKRAGVERGLSVSNLAILLPPDGKPASLALDIAMLARLWDYINQLSPSENVGEHA